MFQETLLESSAKARRRNRWPMATAFLMEVIVASVIVAVPLLSTGVIPVFARYQSPTLPVPLASAPPKPVPSGTGSGSGFNRPAVVTVAQCSGANCIRIGNRVQTSDIVQPPNLNIDGPGYAGPDFGVSTDRQRPSGPGGPGPGRMRLSNPSEAQLIKRVEPIYPHIAQVSGISGIVKLHAIIAKDGSIESLSVISGHPILAKAALDAVEKWKYRPYILNGETVEVETFITVNFRRDKL